jgi:hypothetical protein
VANWNLLNNRPLSLKPSPRENAISILAGSRSPFLAHGKGMQFGSLRAPRKQQGNPLSTHAIEERLVDTKGATPCQGRG